MPLRSLVDDGLDHPVVAPASPVIFGDSAQIRRSNGLRYRAVSGGGPWVNLSAVHVTVPWARPPAALAHHEGEELLYVLSGVLKLSFEHQTHLLSAGDSAHFDARQPHRLSAAGDRDAEVLLVAHVPHAHRDTVIEPATKSADRARPRNITDRKTNAGQRDFPETAVVICRGLDQLAVEPA
jgi:quercetin dioxygenase-like cupin family protein